MSFKRNALLGVMLVIMGYSPLAFGDTETVRESGSATVTLSPLPSEPGAADERWRVQASAQGSTIEGSVRVAGVPVERPDQLGKVEWELNGSQLSGTIHSPAGNFVIAWFRGTVESDVLQGTFTAINGKSGSWKWEGPPPQRPSSE